MIKQFMSDELVRTCKEAVVMCFWHSRNFCWKELKNTSRNLRVLDVCTACVTFKTSVHFCPRRVRTFLFSRFKQLIYFWTDFIMETRCVSCKVGTEFLCCFDECHVLEGYLDSSTRIGWICSYRYGPTAELHATLDIDKRRTIFGALGNY